MALSKTLCERSSSKALQTCDGHTRMGILVVSFAAQPEKGDCLTALQRCSWDSQGLGLSCQLENVLCQLAASVRGLLPDLQFVIATHQRKADSRVCHASTQVLQTPFCGPFCMPVRVLFFLPSAENLVQNLPVLIRNVVIFS